MTKEFLIILFLLLTGGTTAWGQSAPEDSVADNSPALPVEVKVGKVLFQGDSIPHIIMPTLQKYPPLTFKNEKERKQYSRLIRNVKKTLPLAKTAKLIVIETYEYLETLPNDKARSEHLKKVEKGLKAQFTPVIRRLSRSQGRLLVKLIDRECGQTGYHIAQAFIGSFKANAYQTLAFCFGQSLTKHYDPEGEDQFIERVVLMIESGQL